MRLLLLVSSLLASTALAAGGTSIKPNVPGPEPTKVDKPIRALDDSASKPPGVWDKFAKDDTLVLPNVVRKTAPYKQLDEDLRRHKYAKDDSVLDNTRRDPNYIVPERLRPHEGKKFGIMYKRALKKSHVSLRRIKKKLTRVKNKINKGLAKLSGKEKKLHNYLARNIKRSYKFVARQMSKVRIAISVALEPILGARIVFALDRLVGGAVIIGKAIGKFVIDHQAVIVGIAVGILVSLAVTGGLTMVTMNPLLAGAIGGAAGGISSTVATHLWGAVVHGNLVPTSLEEAGRRTKRVAKEAAVSAVVGAVAGVISAGIGGAISGGHAAAAGAGAHGAAAHGAAQGGAHASTQAAGAAAAHGANPGLTLGAVEIGHPSHVVAHIVGDMGHHAVMKPIEKGLEAETGVATKLATSVRGIAAK